MLCFDLRRLHLTSGKNHIWVARHIPSWSRVPSCKILSICHGVVQVHYYSHPVSMADFNWRINCVKRLISLCLPSLFLFLLLLLLLLLFQFDWGMGALTHHPLPHSLGAHLVCIVNVTGPLINFWIRKAFWIIHWQISLLLLLSGNAVTFNSDVTK
jgi:hypothetical protein